MTPNVDCYRLGGHLTYGAVDVQKYLFPNWSWCRFPVWSGSPFEEVYSQRSLLYKDL